VKGVRQLSLLVALAAACHSPKSRIQSSEAADVFADCMEDDVVSGDSRANEPLEDAIRAQRLACTARSGWTVDVAAYDSCTRAQARADNAFLDPRQDAPRILRAQMRTCSRRAGHLQ